MERLLFRKLAVVLHWHFRKLLATLVSKALRKGV
jgi:hypothetical protein